MTITGVPYGAGQRGTPAPTTYPLFGPALQPSGRPMPAAAYRPSGAPPLAVPPRTRPTSPLGNANLHHYTYPPLRLTARSQPAPRARGGHLGAHLLGTLCLALALAVLLFCVAGGPAAIAAGPR